MKKLLNFLFLAMLPISGTNLFVSCNRKAINLKNEIPLNQQTVNNENSREDISNFLQQLDFKHTKLNGTNLDESMKFEHYETEVKKQIYNYITNNFKPNFSVIVDICKSVKTLKQDKNKIKCKICCDNAGNKIEKDFEVKFKNVKSNFESESDSGFESDSESEPNLLVLEEIKTKLTANLIDGSTLDELIPIGSTTNKNKILELIEIIINNKDIKVDLLTPSNMNLSQTDNTITIRISNNSKNKEFDIKFKNVKTYSEKMIDNLLENTQTKFDKPVDGTDFDDQTKLNNECICKLKNKIKNIIKDERISFNVKRSSNTLHQLNFKIRFEISINHKNFNNKLKQVSLTLEDVLFSDWHKILRQIKDKIETDQIDCKFSIKDDANLIYQENQEKIKNIITSYIDNKDVDLSILTRGTLKEVKNKIKVNIKNKLGSLEKECIVTLTNLKIFNVKELNKTKLEEFKNVDLKGYFEDCKKEIDLAIEAKKTELQKKRQWHILNVKQRERVENDVTSDVCNKKYKRYKLLLGGDVSERFFNSWWKKLNKINMTINSKNQFDQVYAWLEKTVFTKISKEHKAVEKILIANKVFDWQDLLANENISNFHNYLKEILKIINGKFYKYSTTKLPWE